METDRQGHIGGLSTYNIQFSFDFRAYIYIYIYFSRFFFSVRVFVRIKVKRKREKKSLHIYKKKEIWFRNFNCIKDRSRFVTMFRFDIFLILHLSRPIEMQKNHTKKNLFTMQWKRERKKKGDDNVSSFRQAGMWALFVGLDQIALVPACWTCSSNLLIYLSIPLLWIWTSRKFTQTSQRPF